MSRLYNSLRPHYPGLEQQLLSRTAKHGKNNTPLPTLSTHLGLNYSLKLPALLRTQMEMALLGASDLSKDYAYWISSCSKTYTVSALPRHLRRLDLNMHALGQGTRIA